MHVRPDRTARLLGLIVGLAVGSLFSAAAVGAEAVGFSISSIVTLPILATAALGGWLVGPAAVMAHDRSGWLELVVGFGFLAVLLGDLLVATALLIGFIAQPGTTIGASNIVQAIVGASAGVIEVILLGLIGFGWVALPFTLAASAIWTAVMRGLSTRLRMDG